MARTQRRRKKHRGTQAGTLRQRSRGPSRGSQKAPMTASERRIERMNRPPSWRSALNRAGIAAGVFLAVLLILLKQPVGDSLALAGFMLLVYVPIGYAIDSFLYRLRQKRKAGETER